jgi:hypothetical protein
MTEQQMDVQEVEAETTPVSTENNEQVQEQVEGVTTTTDGKDYKAIAEQLSKDIQEKNRKIQELKGQIQPQQQAQVTVEEQSEDDTVKRFLRTEATTMINNKMLTDPNFKDRAPIVASYVEQGYSFDMADKMAKADILDQILTGSSNDAQQQINQPTITPKAIPEEEVVQRTGNVLDDIEKGIVDVDPALAATIKKYRRA